jgi:tRNA threonylcarbamoyladenosine biosynthesis protein TsaB
VTLLAFDTASPATAVALRSGNGATSELRDDPGPGVHPRHTEALAIAVELLRNAGIGWREVQRVAVDVGPGGFTGLRVGIATARALAQSIGCELVGVGSLAALAHGAAADGWRLVVSVLDARRGEVFAAAYECLPPSLPRELEAPAAISPDALGALLGRLHARVGGDQAILAAGDGAIRYPEPLARAGAVVPPHQSSLHQIRATSLCALGADKLLPDGYESVVPEYLRRPDAELALAGATARGRAAAPRASSGGRP